MLSGLINFIKEKISPQPKNVELKIEEPVKVESKVEEKIEPVLDPVPPAVEVVVPSSESVSKTKAKKPRASRKKN